jgi:hypothetical protein
MLCSDGESEDMKADEVCDAVHNLRLQLQQDVVAEGETSS